MSIFLIVALSITAYFVIARIVSKIVLYKHIKSEDGNCGCDMTRMNDSCWNETPGFVMAIGSAFWPAMFLFFLADFIVTSGAKIVDSPVVFVLDKLSKNESGHGEDDIRQSRAMRKANERLELAKIHQQEALALEAAFDSNARLLNKKEALNPLYIER